MSDCDLFGNLFETESVQQSTLKEQQQICIDCPDLIKIFKNLLDKEEMTDCHFVFNNENCEEDDEGMKIEHRISAHKYDLTAAIQHHD